MVDRLFGPVEMEKCMSQYSVQNGSYDMMQCKKGKKKKIVTSMLSTALRLLWWDR